MILTSSTWEQFDSMLGGAAPRRARAAQRSEATVDRFGAATLRPRRRTQTSRGDHRLDRILSTSQRLHQSSTRRAGAAPA